MDKKRPLAAVDLRQAAMSAVHQFAAIPDCNYPCSFKLKLRITLFELAVDPPVLWGKQVPTFYDQIVPTIHVR
jgi:hypothetical protein